MGWWRFHFFFTEQVFFFRTTCLSADLLHSWGRLDFLFIIDFCVSGSRFALASGKYEIQSKTRMLKEIKMQGEILSTQR